MTTATTIASETRAATSRSQFPTSMLAVACLTATAFVPLLGAHLFQLWVRPHYQFFPIVFVGAGILAYVRFPGVAALQPGGRGVGWCLTGVSWLVLAAAEILNSSLLAALAALVLLLAVIWAAGGRTLLRQMLPAWLFLWLIIPPPFGLDNILVLALQRLTTQWSSSLLDQCRVFHVIAGNVVEVGNRRLFVAEACAGINSLFSILACAIFYVFFTRTGPIRAALLVLSAISWVLLANMLRVFLVAYLAQRWEIDVAEGWRHEVLGYGLFVFALVLIWSTDRLLSFVTPSRWCRGAGDDPSGPSIKLESAAPETGADFRASWLNSWVAGGAFGFLLAVHLAFYTFPEAAPTAIASQGLHLDRVDQATLPEKLHRWQFEKYLTQTRNPGSAFGEFSQTWVYRADAQGATFSFDYPFPGWHELQVCYLNQGWEVEEKADRASDQEGAPAFYSERQIKKAGMRYAHLLFCEFDRTGQSVEPERGGISAGLRRHESAFQRWIFWDPSGAAPLQPKIVAPVYQFQLLVECDAPLTRDEAAAVQALFFRAHQSLRQQLFD